MVWRLQFEIEVNVRQLFLFLTALFLSTELTAATFCADLFSEGYYRKIQKMADALYKNQGTRVVLDAKEIGESGLIAYYDTKEHHIVLNPAENDINQYFHLHHEAIHSNTQHQLATNPNNPENILAMQVFREGAPIHKNIPPGYANAYSADEMKTYAKGSQLIFHIAEQRKKLSINKTIHKIGGSLFH